MGAKWKRCAPWSVLQEYGCDWKYDCRGPLWNLGFLASCGLFWYGRKGSPSASTTGTSKPFSLTKFGTQEVAITWPPRYTWWWKPSSGFTRLSGGWGRGWWRSANALVTKECYGWAVNRRFTRRASSRFVNSA